MTDDVFSRSQDTPAAAAARWRHAYASYRPRPGQPYRRREAVANGMAAVNEHLVRPLTWEDFVIALDQDLRAIVLEEVRG